MVTVSYLSVKKFFCKKVSLKKNFMANKGEQMCMFIILHRLKSKPGQTQVFERNLEIFL